MNSDLQTLSTEKKIKLAEELWKSVETERLSPLTAARRQLLEKRIKQHQQNPDEGRPWKEIKKKYEHEKS